MSDYFYDPHKTFEQNSDQGPFVTSDEYASQGEPQTSVLGVKVHTPFGIPAGPLMTSRHTTAAFKRGFDVVTYKTQRTVPFSPNIFPHVLPLDVDGDLTLEKAAQSTTTLKDFPEDPTSLTITNSFGNPGKGPDFWVEDIKKALAGVGDGQLLIFSVVGTIQDGFSPEDYYDDFAKAAKLAVGAGAQAIELNLSCPNVASEGVLCYSPDAVLAICKKTREAVGADVKIVAKVGYYSQDQQELLEQIVDDIVPYIDAICTINTIPSKIVDSDGNQALKGEGRLTSGCCGAGVKWAGIDMVDRLFSLRKERSLDFEIIGVGGVMTPEDYQHYIDHGADCVQSATGAMWNSQLAQQIKASLNS